MVWSHVSLNIYIYGRLTFARRKKTVECRRKRGAVFHYMIMHIEVTHKSLDTRLNIITIGFGCNITFILCL